MSTPIFAFDTPPGSRNLRSGQKCLVWGLVTIVVGVTVSLSGCATSLDVSALKPGSGLERKESIDGIMGPAERKLKQVAWERQKRELTAGRNPRDKAALAEFEAAKKLLESGRPGEAEKAFKALAKSRRWNGLSWAERAADAFQTAATGSHSPSYNQYGDPIEEDALFMIAECQFAQKKYSWAQDSYDTLLEKYPSTRHLDDTTRRMFDIAHEWMGFPKPDAEGDIKLASGQLLQTNPRVGQKGFEKPSFLNVTDRTRPVFDTAGRALQALESIWLHDPNGPLADDALMLTANYHLQTADFVEAARVYQLLREQYPDSPHFKDAYVLESHVRLASYEGPGYDAKALTDSKDLKQSARELFPDLSEQQKAMLDKELQNIAIAEVRREWHKVEFYRSKGDEAAVALHCNKILNRYPDSRYAGMARRELEAIADRRRKGTGFNLFSDDAASRNSPVLAGLGSPPPRQTQPRPTDPDAGRAQVGPSSTPRKPAAEEPGFFRRFLRRPDADPKLKPVKPEGEADEDATGRVRLN